MADRSNRIGVDLGGTKTEVVLLDEANRTLLRSRKPTPADQGYEAILDVVVSLVEEAKASSTQQATVGIGIPGIIDSETNLVLNANTTIMIGHPLQSDLEQRLNQPVRIENDANCFALAEATMGAGQGYGTVFGVIMGTGCGGGIVIQDQLHSGRHGIAGEWGHVSIDPDGPQCWCGNPGCVETLISGGGLQKRYLSEFQESKTVPEIVEAARNGQSREKQFFERFLEDYGRALGGLISILDPDAVILGGGLSNLDELYTLGRDRVLQYTFHKRATTPILKNKLGDSAGVFGAANLWND
ncbi:MAG TPA: N-acetylglucosamine kinase [Leptospiraceae bacterium]|nr:N-acetylglucosamine kinase [Spirochaetaceae bacterium]HBS06028.1 N-acetylglucosamine kinase [Leptospiraceae bacterium]|tara:strand:- start:404 stop:1300 length:897 start_codon:yes stop_codon:yes gene_type:complete